MTKALQSVALGLMDEHLSHCVVQAAAGGPEADEKLREALEVIAAAGPLLTSSAAAPAGGRGAAPVRVGRVTSRSAPRRSGAPRIGT